MMTRTRFSLGLIGVGALIAACARDHTAPTPAGHLEFTSQPAASAASLQSIGSVAVSILADDGRPIAGSNATVVIALEAADTGAHLAGTTSVVAQGGVATFTDLKIAKAGAGYRLHATASGSTDAQSDSFTVTAGAPAKLLFDPIGNGGFYSRVGNSSPIYVSVIDSSGNVVTTATNAITVAYTRTAAFGTTFAPDGLFGTTTRAAVNGKATFDDLTFHKSGTYSLTATATGLATTNSLSTFLVQNGDLTALRFLVQPTSAKVGASIPQFAVLQVDAFGNAESIPPGSNYSTAITLGNNPGGATMGGTLSASGFGSQVQFYSNVTLDKVGTGYTIVVTSGTRTATSAPFNITP